MMKLMRGGKRARRKANLMISEKINAAFEAKRAYQAKLLEMAQGNMTFAFEFSQRLAAIRSPAEFLRVTTEFIELSSEPSSPHDPPPAS
jgi:hypothetical protein